MGRQVASEHLQQCRAYEVYSEWGPNRGIPRMQRLMDEFPDRSPEELQAWIAEFNAVGSLVSTLAREGGTARPDTDSVMARLTAAHPWIGRGALNHALFMADYEAWHDGVR